MGLGLKSRISIELEPSGANSREEVRETNFLAISARGLRVGLPVALNGEPVVLGGEDDERDVSHTSLIDDLEGHAEVQRLVDLADLWGDLHGGDLGSSIRLGGADGGRHANPDGVRVSTSDIESEKLIKTNMSRERRTPREDC